MFGMLMAQIALVTMVFGCSPTTITLRNRVDTSVSLKQAEFKSVNDVVTRAAEVATVAFQAPSLRTPGQCNSQNFLYFSSNTSIVSAQGAVEFSGIWPNCTASISPIANASGTSTITIVLSIGGEQKAIDFRLTILPVNNAPTISSVAAQSAYSGAAAGPIPFSIGDIDSSLNCSTSVTAASSNATVLPVSNITIAGTAPNCTVSFTPVATQIGSTNVTLTVSDGTLSAQQSFTARILAKSIVLGQSDFASSVALTEGLSGSTPGGYSAVLGMNPNAYIFASGTKFVMSEPNRNRVKLWNSIPSSLGNPDVILGQSDQFSILLNAGQGATAPSASTLNAPSGVWTDGTQLIVADRANNRVLIWNSWPTTNKQAADVVVGQADFFTVTASRTQQNLSSPSAVNVIAGKLVVSDSSNFRVMIWNSIPATNFAPADAVWGQADFTTSISTTTANTVHSSTSPVQYAGGKIIVASGNRSRVAFINGIPAGNNPNIQFVIGQPSLTAQDVGSPECIASFTGACANSGGLGWPMIHSDGTRLFVSDQTYNRVLVWNTAPTASNTPPDLVLGQNDFSGVTSNAGGVSASSLSFPGHMASTSTHLYVVDELNNRILRFPLSGLTNNVAADAVLGVDSATRGATATTANYWMTPEAVFKLGNKLAIADAASNRVLLYNSAPAADYVTPDVVLGQSDFIRVGANAGGVSESSLYAPLGVILVGDGTNAGTKVIVSDTGNNRLLIWNTWPTTNKQAANVVVGQSLFTSNTANSPTRSGATLSAPAQIWSDGTRLLVADTNNSRVLYFSAIPTSPGAIATRVLGQTADNVLTTNLCTASSMRTPMGVWSDGTKIYVTSAHSPATSGLGVGYRIMVWSAFPTADGSSASAVLGQTSLTECVNQTASASSLNGPRSILGAGSKLVVADSGNHRVLIWNTLPTTTNTAADIVLGQTSFAGAVQNAGTQFGLSGSAGVWTDGISLMVADKNNRALRTWKQFPTAIGQTFESVNAWLCNSANSWCQSGIVPSASNATTVGPKFPHLWAS